MNKVEKHFVLIFFGVRWYLDPSIYEKGLNDNLNSDQSGSVIIVKVTLNLSLSRCMFSAHSSSNFHPIFMKFEKR